MLEFDYEGHTSSLHMGAHVVSSGEQLLPASSWRCFHVIVLEK